jgi:hypothetical protein
MAVQMRWTKLIEDALNEESGLKNKGLIDAKAEISNILNHMKGLCKQDLPSKLIRLKYETIVTILVYLDEQIRLMQANIKPKSFNWQKYTRRSKTTASFRSPTGTPSTVTSTSESRCGSASLR